MNYGLFEAINNVLSDKLIVKIAPLVREMEVMIYMEKNEIIGYKPLVDDLKCNF